MTQSNDQQTVVVLGASPKPERYSNKAIRLLQQHRHRVIPVHPAIAKIEGLEAGCIEALMLNHRGEVAECTGDNIFLVRAGELLTPPPDASILKGITRDAVFDLAAAAGITVREITLQLDDVYAANECFLTGTAAEVVPVVKVDGKTIGDGGPGPITRDLIQRFQQLRTA